MAVRKIHIETNKEVLAELARLRGRLEIAESTLQAIHSGDVDAIIVQSERGERIYTFDEAERPYRVLIEEMSQGAVTLGAEGRILYCNQFFAGLVGRAAAELVGTPLVSLLHDESVAAWERFMRAKEPDLPEIELSTPTEPRLPVRVAVSHLVARGEMDLGLIITDLREQKRTERLLHDRAERETQARAEAERLYREVLAASRLKDEFLATVSHELRTPLNAIMGFSELLLAEDLTQDAAHAAATIFRNAKAQSQIIDDLLDVSRIVTGKLLLNVRPTKLAAVASAAVETVRLAAAAKGLHLVLVVDDAVGHVLGDPSRLQQVLWNLLSNAVKYTPEGGRIEISVGRDGPYARVVVSDDGKGIDPSFLPFVFDRFRQEDGSITRRFGGLGLGLAIVRHVVEAHGGTVTVTSEGRGRGTTAVVSLPLMRAAAGRGSGTGATVEHDPARAVPALASAQDRLRGTRVLVVDDEHDTRVLFSEVLKRAGADVQSLGSTKDVAAALKEFRPDVLLCDVGMPEENGLDLIRRIRSSSPADGGDVPAAAVTAYATEGDRQGAFAAGFQAHVGKPVDAETLIATVTGLVDRRPRQPARAPTPRPNAE